MVIFFLFMLCSTASIYLFSRRKYDTLTAPADAKRYPLKAFLPVGFFLLDIFKYSYNTGYDRRLLTKIIEISGFKYSRYFLKVHWANKITFIIFALLFISLIGMSTGPDPAFGIFGAVLPAAIAYFTDNELNEKIKKRRTAIRMDFPDFINKLILLINAGMTVTKAWEKTVLDNRKDSVLFEELGSALADIKSGKSEKEAYEDFAKRCRMPEVTRFVSVIIQNMKKGGNDMVSILRLQAADCWESRKNAARKLGEEASTRMLLPMMIMFLAILLIVAVPAVLAIRGI